MADTLASHAHTPVMLKSTGSERRVIEYVDNSANRAPRHVVKTIADVILNNPVHILLTDVSGKQVHVPKRIIAAHVTYNLARIITTKTALLETDSKVIGAVNHKLSVDRNNHMTRHKDVKSKGYHNLKLGRKSKVQLLSDYAKYHDRFLSMLSEYLSK